MPGEMQIRCFMEVANRLSFTLAASELFITQQACSKYIAALEKEVQFPLFERSTRKVSLTEDGKRLYSALIRFESEYSTILKIGRQHYAAQNLDIHFGLMNGTSSSILVDGVHEVKKSFPEIKLNWSYGEQHEIAGKVKSGNLDIALIFKDCAEIHPYLSWRELFQFHGYLLLSAHLTDDKENIPYELLSQMTFSAHKQFGLSEKESIQEAEKFLKRFKLPYKNIRLYNSVDDSMAAVETGEGFTITPPIFQHAFYVPYLNKYPLDNTAEIGCIWNPSSRNPNTEAIVDILVRASKESKLFTQILSS